MTRHLAIPKDMPGALTSDVVVTEDEVIYNCCASGVLARVRLADFSHVSWINERPAPREQLRAWRAGVGNLVEILSRVNLPICDALARQGDPRSPAAARSTAATASACRPTGASCSARIAASTR